jgi:hypothetical protein
VYTVSKVGTYSHREGGRRGELKQRDGERGKGNKQFTKLGRKYVLGSIGAGFFIKEVGSGLRSGSEAIIWIWIRPGRKVPDLILDPDPQHFCICTIPVLVPSSNVRVSPYSKQTKT